MGEYTDDPVIRCAKCGGEFSPSVAFELREGSEADCPTCNTVLVCDEIAYSRQWRWVTKETAK